MNNTTQPGKWQDNVALERYRLISPLLDETLDIAKKLKLREKTAERSGISVRSLYRYEKAYLDDGFEGLKPRSRQNAQSSRLPKNFPSLMEECIQLKREVPLRSASQIIMILEMEGKVAPGVLKRSTIQKHLHRAGFSKAQMKKMVLASQSSSCRWWKPHRMMLAEADIKYGPKLPIGKNGKLIQTYLVVIIDNHSRYVIGSGFFDNMEAQIVEDTYRKTILAHGKMEAVQHDNGGQFVATQLQNTFSRLGIRLIRCKVFSPQAKGAVEVFNRFVNAFSAEAEAKHVKTLVELNHYWDTWLEMYYHKKPHEGLADYYRNLGVDVPPGGITPEQEWNRDSRPLVFLDVNVVAEAFLHHETRKVNNAGCISFRNRDYDVGSPLSGREVEIAYDPQSAEELTVSCEGMIPFTARPVAIGEFCAPKPMVPSTLLPTEPETSRFLDSLETKRKEMQKARADAISFGRFRKE